jgi:hypothetical protein
MVDGSVGSGPLEGLEHQIPHRADVCFDALQPVGVGFAVLGALLVEAFALGGQFVLKACQHGLVGEGFAGHSGRDGEAAAHQRGDGGGQAVIAEGLGYGFEKGGLVGHDESFVWRRRACFN